MTNLRPILWTVLLLCLPLAPAIAAPPIRCVHQTTVMKDGKATTHLILTTAKPGEAQTANNMVDVVYPGIIGAHLRFPNEIVADKILSNANGSIVAVNFTPDNKLGYYQTYLFVSSNHGIIVLRDFTAQVSRLLKDKGWFALRKTYKDDPLRNPFVSRAFWRQSVRDRLQHELMVLGIERNSLDLRAQSNEVSDLDFGVTISSTGHLHLEEIEWSGE